MLTVVYILLFLLQLLGLVRGIRRNRGLGLLAVLDLAAAAAALGLMGYYDALSARGSMTGWAYFPEVFASLCAAAAFALMALAALVFYLIEKRKT